ncbi:DUF2145 domain-containing protein [Pseudoalteromonas phenolica]|uniref:DUF2145 domain-containing protein n=1 Tax=Pseudoalteromonas phenolica TaxID=161398 RepID=UPI00110B4B72|nr:DUF2145 domain-containing protein [Pseudoalteromonas phenolica]TMO58033.1 DUF2145 domain-containing protein [Pseudoalteromonas phenolica]
MRYFNSFFFSFVLLLSLDTFAGSQQNSESKFSAEEVASFAKSVEKYAAKQGARAFIIARLGQPENDLPHGFQFTHTAIAVYSEITLDNGEKAKGYAIYNLYQNADNPAKSTLMTDYPVDFFWGVESLKAGIIIPSPDLQQRLIEAIASGKNQALHNPNYSLIANPFNNQFQNCTEHTLNVINAAIYETDDMTRIKANTEAYFTPQPVKVSRFKLALGNWFAKGVSTEDHGRKIQTTSFTSIGRYLQEFGLMEEAVVYGDGEAYKLF